MLTLQRSPRILCADVLDQVNFQKDPTLADLRPREGLLHLAPVGLVRGKRHVVHRIEPDPVDDEAIRRQQFHERAVLHELQRPNPGVELLLGKLGLECA